MADVIRYPFTRARLDSEPLPNKGQRKVVWDEEVAGFCLRLTADGAKTFYLSKWAQGGQRWLKLGNHPEASVKDARINARAQLAKIDSGLRPWEDRRKSRKEATLQDLWDQFKAHAKGRKRDSTLRGYGQLWDRELAPWKARRLSGISRGDVQRLANSVGKRAPIMANRLVALVSVLFTKAGDLWKGENPAKGVDRFPEHARERFLKPEELRAFFLAVETEGEELWRIFFTTAIMCGARRSNLCGMRWRDLDLDQRLWRVPGEKSKTGEPLSIVLPTPLVTTLRDWNDRCGSPEWVFPSSDPGDLSTSPSRHVVDPKRPWHRILCRAELFRLVATMAQHHKWTESREKTGRVEALSLVDQFRVLGLGRKQKVQGEPLDLAVEHHRKQVAALGIDPDPGSLLDLRVHDLRRTLASWMALGGGSLPIIGRALGHRSSQSTEVYARLTLAPVHDAVGAAAEAILTHGGPAARRLVSQKETKPRGEPEARE